MTDKEFIDKINATLKAERVEERLCLLFDEVYDSQDRKRLSKLLKDVIVDDDFIINPLQKNLLIKLLEKYNNTI